MRTSNQLSSLVLTTLLACGAIGSAIACGSGESSSTGESPFGGSGGNSGNTSSGAGGNQGNTGGTSQTSGGSFNLDGGNNSCVCETGVCVGDTCCEVSQVCGNICCGEAEVCSFQACVVPGASCVDSDDCGEGKYCEFSLGEPAHTPDAGAGGAGNSCVAGATPATGRCLDKPPECAPGQGPGDPIECLERCEYKPPTGPFDPVLKYHWDGGSIMMTPIVIQLDDDNCDGKVDEKDIPEIVFTTFAHTKPTTGDNGQAVYNQHGTIHAISIVNGAIVEKWSFQPDIPFDDRIHPGRHLAGGDIDGVPGNEILVCTQTGRTRALKADGSELWISDAKGCFMPSIADLDQDGTPEVLTGDAVLDGATGATKFVISGGSSGSFADIDGDGYLDVVTPTRAYDRAGTLIANTGLSADQMAIGDFDRDGKPEIVAVQSGTHSVHIWQIDKSDPSGFKILRQDIDINGTFTNHCPAGSAGETRGGGPPTVADFNGDGTPDVAIATGIGYTVLDGTKLLNSAVPNNETNLWLKETKDCSSAATGSSIFDFEGDGKAEVVYADEHTLRIYDGTNGDVLWSTCNTSGTLSEYPLVADVDNDGHADLIVISNDYSGITCLDDTGVPDGVNKTRGVRIFGDVEGKWVRTRRIWNQHTYHVTNVNEDGSIPKVEAANWLHPRLNNFRQNVQPAGEFNAPDLVVELKPLCGAEYSIAARVRNVGWASVPPGVVVGFYEGDPAAGGTRLGEAFTSKTLAPAESEDLHLVVSSPSAAIKAGTATLYAVVDDGSPAHAWTECRTENNTSAGVTSACDGPK